MSTAHSHIESGKITVSVKDGIRSIGRAPGSASARSTQFLTADNPSTFGSLLALFRRQRGFTQKELGTLTKSVSGSYIGMLESEERGRGSRILTRKQVWDLIVQLNLLPLQLDRFLEAAHHATDRTELEEVDIQRRFPLVEMYVFAQNILDMNEPWLSIVANNIREKGSTYRYFTEEPNAFWVLRDKLVGLGLREADLKQRLECTLLPEEVFLSYFAIYNPGLPDMYCCGTKPQQSKAATFFTLQTSEASRLYKVLHRWRMALLAKRPIVLDDVRQLYPLSLRSAFGHELPARARSKKSSKRG